MKIPQAATRSFGSAKLSLSKNAPTILTVSGVAGFIATTFLTVRSTTKAVDRFPKISRDVAEVRERETSEGYPDVAKAKDLVAVYTSSSVELLRIYAPPLVVGTLSIAAVLSGHGLMMKRQAQLIAAYAALDAGFKAYRARVREELGEEKELDLYRKPKYLGSCEDIGVPCEIDPDDRIPSPYARFFDESSPSWSKTPEYNLLFLRSQQDYANDRLRARGHIFLNEVYDSLGLERSQAGQVVGWKLDGNGDGFVDFGLYQIGDESNRAFINLLERTVLLDFNVDGPIRI